MRYARSFVLGFLLLLLGCVDRAEPETFLIEKGYRGKINVVFNESNGQAEKYEDGRRIYEIPVNGILITRFKDNYGIMNQQYFYVDSRGAREALKTLDVSDFNEAWTTTKNRNEPSRDEVAVFFAARVGVYGNSEDPKSLKFQEFYVSTYRELKKYQDQKYEEEFLDKVMRLTGVRF
jgi:hypothetical protein